MIRNGSTDLNRIVLREIWNHYLGIKRDWNIGGKGRNSDERRKCL